MVKSLTFQVSPKFKDENLVGLCFLSGSIEDTKTMTLQQLSACTLESGGLSLNPGFATY